MPRQASAAMLAALAAPVVRCALFVQAQFAASTLNLWSGLGNTVWNGQSWSGVYGMHEISVISEDSTVEARGITLALSGIPSDLISDVLAELRVGLPVSVWLACYDASGNLIASPILAYAGRIDQPTIDDSGETCSVAINVENVLVDLNRSVWRRYSPDDLQIVAHGDAGFQFVPGIQEITTYWGRLPANYNNR